LVRVALEHDYDSQILLVVPISAFFLYRKRREVFANVRWDYIPALILFLPGVALGIVPVLIAQFRSADYLWIRMLALIIIWIAGFVFFYGFPAFRFARFPLFFLLLLLPIPNFLVERFISLLQQGSAFVAFWLFKALNVPVMREELVFHIPSLDLEVAKECSGIRSSVILLVTTLLVAEFVLRSAWRKLVIMLCVIPIVILKNGLRIVTISLLTIYVNRGFLHGWLHQSGGIVFYMLGLLSFLPILNLLKRGEIEADQASSSPAPSALRERQTVATHSIGRRVSEQDK
jgi:exosortase